MNKKIKSPEALKRTLTQLQKSKKSLKTVFTNGCFDLLHKGHITYLQQARACGDCLIIALNSDASVQRLKGPTRPLNTLADRMEVVAALESIQYVTWFEEDSPLNLILKLKPMVLVKGGDWAVEQIVGAKEVLSWKGKVKSLPYLEGHSTTGIIQKTLSQHDRQK